jgi:hypothetical protein
MKLSLSGNSSLCVAALTPAKGVITNTKLTTNTSADKMPTIFLLNFHSLYQLYPLPYYLPDLEYHSLSSAQFSLPFIPTGICNTS